MKKRRHIVLLLLLLCLEVNDLFPQLHFESCKQQQQQKDRRKKKKEVKTKALQRSAASFGVFASNSC